MIFCFWSCKELEICATMKIIDFVTHIASASSLLDLPDQSGAARLHSYNFLCSISLCTTTNNIFSEPKITLTLSIFIKRLEKQTVHCGFTQITRYSILHVFILLYEKFLQFDWLRAADFSLIWNTYMWKLQFPW